MTTIKLSKTQNQLIDRILVEMKAKENELLETLRECGIELNLPQDVQFNVQEILQNRAFSFDVKVNEPVKEPVTE